MPRRWILQPGLRLHLCLALGVLLVAMLADTATAQRGRRVRRVAAAMAARANAFGPVYIGPGFYPPIMPPPGIFLSPPLGAFPRPLAAQFGRYAGPTGDDPTIVERRRQTPNELPFSPAAPAEQQEMSGPQLRPPTNNESAPPEAVPVPNGELAEPIRPARPGQPR
jgi:hypothetical protein